MQDQYKVIIGRDGKHHLVIQAYEPVGKQRQAKKKDIHPALMALHSHQHALEDYLLENLKEQV